ncbi:putative signal peptide and transmembrane protein [Rhodopirellula islandica]|uniref:Signal peptide and transmembrane protein n=1 Tax=Rhodopirellula islandica TaxID=595434 RepID=A0A0J1BHZ0_RHOIS|nr:hypothetical protein [Rhodopirellula islandica]KLU06093.1 putative signal peptide and transmembrane protein [Rhodopirellula islandica]
MHLQCGALLLGLMLAGMAVTTNSQVSADAADGEVLVDPGTTFVKVYRLHDLPAWSKDGAFRPALIMQTVQDQVLPKHWEARGGTATMAPYPQDGALVIAAPEKMHERIQAFLDKQRPDK